MQPNKRSRCSTKRMADSVFKGFASSNVSSNGQERQTASSESSTEYLLASGYNPNDWESTYHEELAQSFDEGDFFFSDADDTMEEVNEDEPSEEEHDVDMDFDYESTGKKKMRSLLYILTFFFYLSYKQLGSAQANVYNEADFNVCDVVVPSHPFNNIQVYNIRFQSICRENNVCREGQRELTKLINEIISDKTLGSILKKLIV